jgi:hypothetical protein
LSQTLSPPHPLSWQQMDWGTGMGKHIKKSCSLNWKLSFCKYCVRPHM